jgi:hypothetical protein
VRTIRKASAPPAQRHGDQGQAGGQQRAILEGHDEIRVFKNEAVSVQAGLLVRHEEGCG